MTSSTNNPKRVGQLVLVEKNGRLKHYLLDHTLNGGDVIELCFSGGWVAGRYEASPAGTAHFHFSVELGGGRVWTSSFEIPHGALVRWPAERTTED